MRPNNRNPLDPHLLEVTISNDQIACLGLERESHQIIVVGIVGDDAGRIRGIIESDPLFRQTTSEGRYVFGGDVVLRGYTRVQKGILDFLNEPGADDNLELTIKRGIEGGPGSPQRSEGLVALYCDAPMVERDEAAHGRPLKDGYRVEFADEFDGSRLDAGRWVPAHLPQWSSRAQAAARYSLRSGHLFLQILEDQPPWCPEFDGLTRVSSLQTGVLSGPTGSVIGQHRFNEHVVVREQQAPERLYTPLYGYFEMRARAVAHPSSMVALWMIGYEEAPEHSGEICVCEIFGSDVEPGKVLVGMGVHPFGDPQLVDDFSKLPIDIDATEFHIYAAEWAPTHVDFFVDGRQVKSARQSPNYPMQLMLGIYEFEDARAEVGAGQRSYPKEFIVDYVRGFRPLQGYEPHGSP